MSALRRGFLLSLQGCKQPGWQAHSRSSRATTAWMEKGLRLAGSLRPASSHLLPHRVPHWGCTKSQLHGVRRANASLECGSCSEQRSPRGRGWPGGPLQDCPPSLPPAQGLCCKSQQGHHKGLESGFLWPGDIRGWYETEAFKGETAGRSK